MLSHSTALLGKECREILRARVLWAICLILPPLVGYGFIEAVGLYGEASGSAADHSLAARGLSPLDGLLVPTIGAYYIVLTFLFPFLAIRAIAAEKQSGSLKLLLQLPVSPAAAVGAKLVALLVAAIPMAVPGLSAVMIWRLMGGHVDGPETLNLALGYLLYALAIAGIAFFAASLAENTATAAVVALALVLGSWVLDFAGEMATGWLSSLASFSLTSALRPFERGLFAWPQTWRLLLVGFAFLALAVVWLPPASLFRRLGRTMALALVIFAAGLAGSRAHWSVDLSEDRRNSFNPAEEQALRSMREPLKITVHLSSQDSRFRDLDRNMLDRLRRVVPRLTVDLPDQSGTGSLGKSREDEYGWIVYEYAGKTERSTSNSEEEILSILHDLSGQHVTPVPVADYPGYPLVADARRWGLWFYGVLPSLALLGAWWSRKD